MLAERGVTFVGIDQRNFGRSEGDAVGVITDYEASVDDQVQLIKSYL